MLHDVCVLFLGGQEGAVLGQGLLFWGRLGGGYRESYLAERDFDGLVKLRKNLNSLENLYPKTN